MSNICSLDTNFTGRESNNSLTAFEFKWGKSRPVIPKEFIDTSGVVDYSIINRDNYRVELIALKSHERNRRISI